MLLHISAVQSYIGNQVEYQLGKKLGTKVSIGTVDLGLINRIIIDDVLIYDQKGKDMLDASRISVKFEYLPLLKGKISISSAQLFGLKAALYKNNVNSKPNYQFVLDSLSSKKNNNKTRLDLNINSLVIRNGSIRYDRYDIAPTHNSLNLNHLNVSDLSGHFMLYALTNDSLNLNIKKLSFKESSGLNVNNLSFKLKGNKKEAVLYNLNLRLPNTDIMLGVVSAKYKKVNNSLIIPHFNCVIDKSEVSLSDFTCLTPAFKHFRIPIYIESSISGNFSDIHINKMNMRTKDASFNLLANGNIYHASKNAAWKINCNNLYISTSELHKIVEGFKGTHINIPQEILRLGSIRYTGVIAKRQNINSLIGFLRTDAGNIKMSVNISPNSFSGNILSDNINLKKVLDNNKFGNIATEISVDGSIVKKKISYLKLKGTISNFDYCSYRYKQIIIDGIYKNRIFDGNVSMDDPNAVISIAGRINSSNSLPAVNITANVRNFDPTALKLGNSWKGKKFGFDVVANFSGNSLNNANGTLDINNFDLESKGSKYKINYIKVTASNDRNIHNINFNSDFADATIHGRYDYASIVNSVISYVKSKLPTMPGLTAKRTNNVNNFTIDASIKQSDWLNVIFNLPIKIYKPLLIKGELNDFDRKLNLYCDLPLFEYNGKQYSDGKLIVSSPNDTLKLKANIRQLNNSKPGMSWNLDASAINNRLSSSLKWNNHSKHIFSGVLNAQTQFYKTPLGVSTANIRINPSEILVGDTTWNVKPSYITYSANNLIIDHFAIEHNRQHIFINGHAGRSLNDSVTVDLQDVDVSYVQNLVNFHAVDFSGYASGRALISSAFNSPSAYAKLIVNNFMFENGRMGVLNANVKWNKEKEQLDIDAIANDDNGKTLIKGFVSPPHNNIDLGITAMNTRVEFLKTFCGSFMRDINGYGSGFLRLSGPLSNMNLVGQLVAKGSIGIIPLNTYYTMSNDTIRFVPDEIEFRRDTITDKYGNIGIVSGNLHHKHLTKLSYDVNVEAKKLLSYDTQVFGDNQYYGTVFATGNCGIHGKSGEVTFDINATPEKGSVLVYNVSVPDAINNQKFITWHDITDKNMFIPDTDNTKDSDTSDTDSDENNVDVPTDIRLNFLIDCTPDATLKLIVDSRTNDYIALNGSGFIRATYYNKGSFDMFGNYLVDHGIYKLTIQNVIKKDFQFQEGGSIVFGGDPYNAILNLKALYAVNGVSLSDLNLGNSFTNNNIRVNCFMNIKGTPKTPVVDFSLDMPTVNSEAKQMIYSLINSEEGMNQQVLYLLSIGRFYSQRNNNAAQTNTQQSQTSLAMQSILSGTISQQINNVLGSVINNNNWNFGANISTGNEGWNNAEYEGLLSGRLLNNRLLINGQFGYRDNANATTSFIGDFDIRYLLTPKGSIAIKVYNQTNDRYFTRNSLNTQGVGLILKRDFNSWRDFLFFKKNKDKAKKQQK